MCKISAVVFSNSRVNDMTCFVDGDVYPPAFSLKKKIAWWKTLQMCGTFEDLRAATWKYPYGEPSSMNNDVHSGAYESMQCGYMHVPNKHRRNFIYTKNPMT